MMETRCISGDRDAILRILEEATGCRPAEAGIPDFSVTVGPYALLRDGRLVTEADGGAVFAVLSFLGLCDWPGTPRPPAPGTLCCPIAGWSGTALRNLLAILSARQALLNKALDAKGAFFVSRPLMEGLLRHPPADLNALLRTLHGREDELRGIGFDRDYISLPGFRRGHPEEGHIHRQLAQRMVAVAWRQRWVKPFTPGVRNQKYVFRIWLNSIGMGGPEYEEARRVLMGRLSGRTAQRSLRKEGPSHG